MTIKIEGNALLIGPPGTGKTVWARHRGKNFVSRDPAINVQHDGERSYIYRVAGLPAPSCTEAPFRAPHYTISQEGMVGRFRNGWRWTPGELSLAHGGTLFLDEVQEFPARVLDVIREAFQRQSINFYSGERWLTVPCAFRLIVAGNPCPCGFHGAEYRARACQCPPEAIKRYAERIPAWIREACPAVPIDRYRADVEAIQKSAE